MPEEKEYQDPRSGEYQILDKKIEKLQKAGAVVSLVTAIILVSIITGLVKVGKQ